MKGVYRKRERVSERESIVQVVNFKVHTLPLGSNGSKPIPYYNTMIIINKNYFTYFNDIDSDNNRTQIFCWEMMDSLNL